MRIPFAIAALVAALFVSPSSFAVGYNVDFGSGSGIPSDAHGGPADQPGHWNVITGLEPEPVELFDTEAVASGVTVAFSLPFGPAQLDHPGTDGDVGALMDDYLDLHSVPATMEIHGLPKGSYAITVISWAPDFPGARTSIGFEGRHAVLVGGEWPGEYRRGATHAVLHAHVAKGDVLTIRLFGIGKGTLNGLQIRRNGR